MFKICQFLQNNKQAEKSYHDINFADIVILVSFIIDKQK